MEALKTLVELLDAETPSDIDAAAEKAHLSIGKLRWYKLQEIEAALHQQMYPVQYGRGQMVSDGVNTRSDIPFDDRDQEKRDPSSHG